MKQNKVVAMIPSRMGSSRYPGKPLVEILGLPMIEHVRRRVEQMSFIDQVFVATCDEEIKSVVEKNDGKVIMTADTHERATDRIEEAAHQTKDADVIINVQGDEPMVLAEPLRQLIEPFEKDQSLDCSCLVYPIHDKNDLNSLNIVKTVLSRTNRLIYLSRAAIPGKEISNSTKYFKQSGLMAFSKDYLHKFSQLEPTPLEAKESVDLLRILEHDHWIQGVVSDSETKGIDVADQVKEVEEAILSNPQQKQIFESIR